MGVAAYRIYYYYEKSKKQIETEKNIKIIKKFIE
jgi:hypothetical protein